MNSSIMQMMQSSSDVLNCSDSSNLNLTQLTGQQIDDDDYVDHELGDDSDCSDVNTESDSGSESENQDQENMTNKSNVNEAFKT